MTDSLVNADQNQVITFDHEGKLVLTTSQADPRIDRPVRPCVQYPLRGCLLQAM
jgi:hypothetical protein